MVAKVAFLVLLGTALVLATPDAYGAPKESKVKLTEIQAKSIQEIVEKLKQKFSKALELIKAAWEKVKAKHGELNLKPIHDKGSQLRLKVKEVYRTYKTEGTISKVKIEEIRSLIKEIRTELRKISGKAYNAGKELLHQISQDVQQSLKAMEQKRKVRASAY